jgi:hypothetical protein
MVKITSCQFFTSTKDLPEKWENLAANNSFLSIPYLTFLSNASPVNFTNFYIGLYVEEELQGIGLAQLIDLRQVAHFGIRDSYLTKTLRSFLFKNFSGQLFIVGNNLMTGSHALTIQDHIQPESALNVIQDFISKYFKKSIHLTIWKDLDPSKLNSFHSLTSNSFYKFSAQPNMVLELKQSWKSFDDYTLDLTKKYRDQLKRSRKKGERLVKKILDKNDLVFYQQQMFDLYMHVANHAPFNTFFLPKNHFIELKNQFGSQFRVCGYFLADELVAFNSIILTQDVVETYFLGYNETIQKEYMVYLNMLYDMLEMGIQDGFRKINFGRTAMEIKSSIGAQANWLTSYMQHRNPLINRFLSSFYHILEPKLVWKERHPFKTQNDLGSKK